MTKTNILTYIKAIIYLRFMEFKNNILTIIRHPIRAVIAGLKYLLTIVLIILPFIIQFFSAKKEKNTSNIQMQMVPIDIVGASIILVLVIIFFTNLYRAAIKYYPTQYSLADVNFLFMSPMSSRIIYSFSIIKQIFSSFLSSFIIIIPIIYMLKNKNFLVSNMGIVFVFTGIVLFIMVVKTLNFFLYSVSKKFNIASYIDKIIIVFIGGMIIFLGSSLYKSADVINSAIIVLNEKIVKLLPIIEWTKELIMSGFTGAVPINAMIKLIIFVIVMMFITVYFATDYYEEALIFSEKSSMLKNQSLDQIKVSSKNKKQVKIVNVKWDFKKEYAFLWKALVIYKRNSKGIFNLVTKYIFFGAIGTLLGYVSRNHGYKEAIIYILIFSLASMNSNNAFTEGMEYELNKSYMYLIPGNIKKKMIAVNVISIVKIIIRNLVITMSIEIFLRIGLVQLLSIWVLLNSIKLVDLFTIVVIKFIIPGESTKDIILSSLRYTLEILIIAPAAGIAVLAWFALKKIEISIFIFGLASLPTIMALLLLSEILFKRLEFKK